MRLGLIVALAVIVVVLAIVLSAARTRARRADSGGSDTAATTALFKGVPQQGVTLGKASAPATLIEFADLQCPFCAEYSNNGLATVVKDYVRTGKLRYQLHIRSFLGPDSVKAAGAAAAAAKENRLYQFSDLFYRRQQQENTGYVTPSFLRGVASGAGVDPAKALAGAANPSGQPQVAAAEKLAAQLGSNSHPGVLPAPQGRSPRAGRAEGARRPVDVGRDRLRALGFVTERSLRRATAVLAVIGVAIAGYLTWVHYAGLKPFCVGGGGGVRARADLEVVRAGRGPGRRARPRRLPRCCSARCRCRVTRAAWRPRCWRSSGAGFSAWLTFVELTKIDAICQWCAASAVIMVLLAIVSVIRLLRVE